MTFCAMRLNSVLNFGKHKGKKVANLLKEEANYIAWAINNTRSFPSQEVVDELKSKGFNVIPKRIISNKAKRK